MLIPFSNLKDYALLLSNVLRDFDPETMLWHQDSPILFPNYDKNGFTPYKRVRKPFSVQTLLESLSRSCGYKSYNALLADQKRLDVLDVNLTDLNPAPRNAYYSQIWDKFIYRICESTYENFINKTGPSYLTYRNFKHHDVMNALPFMSFGITALLNAGKDKYQDNMSIFHESYGFVESYYSIALSMLLTAAEMGYREVSGGENGEHKAWLITNIPLRKFLVHEQWQDQDFENFKEQLTSAVYFLFNGYLTFRSQGENPLDTLVSIVAATDIKSDLEYATRLAAFDLQLKGWVLDLSKSVANDTNYYTNLNYKAIAATRIDYKPKEFAWTIKNGLAASNNINDHQIYGTKAFWLNQCYHLFTTKPEQLMHWSTKTLQDNLNGTITGDLTAYQEPSISNRKFSQQFRISGISRFIQNTNNLVNIKDIPKIITVYSEAAYPAHILKMAIHSQIIALLPRESIDFEIHSKFYGDYDEIFFDKVEPGLKNPVLKISEVKPEKWSNKPDLSFDFNIKQLIHSISVQRISRRLIADFSLKPHQPDLAEYDLFDFQNHHGSFDDFMFTTGLNQPQYYCMLKINLFEVPYKSKQTYTPNSEWCNIYLYCSLPNLSLEARNSDDIEFGIYYSNPDLDEHNRFDGFENMISYLERMPDFKKLILESINCARNQWQTHKWFIRGQGAENSNLNTLYQYTAHYPNGTELI